MVVDRDKILQLLRVKGPLVANDIKRVLGVDSFIVGAVLSELKSRGLISITAVKKGGSPFYYLPDNKQKIESLIEYLNPKDQVTVRTLQKQKVINEANAELFTRVSLRNISDFARSFTVEFSQGTYRCWRYFLVSEEQARELLDEKPRNKNIEKKESQIDTVKHDVALQQKESQESRTTQQQLSEKNPISTSSDSNLESTPFYELIINYFDQRDIKTHEKGQLAKDREYYFMVTVPTSVGPLQMYAHCRNKKKLNEGDVAPALLKAKTLDLPCLFLYKGEFTKKALNIIETEYKGILLKRVSKAI